MQAVFFDLETSDQEPIGQILNFAFVFVGRDLRERRRLTGRIRISRLQLPVPAAILTNKIDVLQHQSQAEFDEPDAMLEIIKFLNKAIQESKGQVALVGFNSNRFDLRFLRTSLIRNGINPYLGGVPRYKDLLHAARKLYISNPDFAAKLRSYRLKEGKLSLSLQSLGQAFSLITGEQSHESLADVRLSLELAELFRKDFALDVLTYDSYEVGRLEVAPRSGMIVYQDTVRYELEGPPAEALPMTVLDADHKYALWINLKRFQEGAGRGAIDFFNPQQSAFFLGAAASSPDDWSAVAEKALIEFKEITLKNFFTTSKCDIEQDIYRLDMRLIGALEQALAGDKRAMQKIKSEDLRTAFLRARLARYEWGGEYDAMVESELKEYALYRYGGSLNLDKFESPDAAEKPPRMHPTYMELSEALEASLQKASPNDAKLLESLKQFYDSSEILRVAGGDLKTQS